MIQSEEVEVFYILPAIRSGMAVALKKMGKRQNEIAGLLCVQESTISQYINAKRASDVKFGEHISKEIAAAAKRIKTKEDLLRETRKLLNLAMKEKVTCQVHKAMANLPDSCRVCFVKNHPS